MNTYEAALYWLSSLAHLGQYYPLQLEGAFKSQENSFPNICFLKWQFQKFLVVGLESPITSYKFSSSTFKTNIFFVA